MEAEAKKKLNSRSVLVTLGRLYLKSIAETVKMGSCIRLPDAVLG